LCHDLTKTLSKSKYAIQSASQSRLSPNPEEDRSFRPVRGSLADRLSDFSDSVHGKMGREEKKEGKEERKERKTSYMCLFKREEGNRARVLSKSVCDCEDLGFGIRDPKFGLVMGMGGSGWKKTWFYLNF
jgi:hypothetical protein